MERLTKKKRGKTIATLSNLGEYFLQGGLDGPGAAKKISTKPKPFDLIFDCGFVDQGL